MFSYNCEPLNQDSAAWLTEQVVFQVIVYELGKLQASVFVWHSDLFPIVHVNDPSSIHDVVNFTTRPTISASFG